MEMHQLDKRLGRMLSELQTLAVISSLPVDGIECAPRDSQDFKPFENGGEWAQDTEWVDFRFTLTVPDGFKGQPTLLVRTGLEAEWEAVNPQFVAWVNGRIEQAFDTKHTALVLPGAKPGATYRIFLQGYAAKGDKKARPPRLLLTLADLDDNTMQLYYDLAMPWEAACLLPEGVRDREHTLQILSQALNLLDLREPHSEAYDQGVSRARSFMDHYYQERARIEPESYADCVGHTHIDVAWLWDLHQTRHKAVRSFATVLKLMEMYPEYKFMSSQPVLYKFVKQDAPELYERIKQRVREGRWEVEGGMWLEADCNLTSGESMVRQLLHGHEFFLKEFGKESKVLWLPDVFGYSAALPQILKKSGIDYFMTSKLSWSEFNLSPYDTFQWKGIDGSEVLTHFTPARELENGNHEGLSHFTTYNAMLKPSQMAGGWKRFQQKALDNEFLVSYGYGDGGGGPTGWMLENARRMKYPLPGTPAVRQMHAREFFENLEGRVKGDPLLPKWAGELYLEYHRGTYTAMARNKRYNRKMELGLREAELWCSHAANLTGMEYPAQALHDIWEDVLTLQFHDILPGSSIKKVYDDAKEIYERRKGELEAILNQAKSALSALCPGDLAAFNSLSAERDDLIWFDAPQGVTALKNDLGEVFPVQRVEGKCCAFVCNLRPMGMTPLYFAETPAEDSGMWADGKGFETPIFKGQFDPAMRIESLYDKRAGRMVNKPGQALGRMVCYENKPHNYDAWDINIYYNQRHFEVDDLISSELVSTGPVLSMWRVRYRYMHSEITQDIYVYRDLDRIDYATQVDFREKQYLLKAHFPVDVFYNEATYDIQFGNVKRPTHRNTSWDVARFEVCAHKWADVSEPGYGVSLLNDCKYGHSINEDGMALTLLKSSTYPNPEADQERHVFTYSLMPHVGDWREGGTVPMAYQLNIPVSTMPAGKGQGAPASLARVDEGGVIIEAVKRQLDGKGLVIRLYECYGRRTRARLKLGFEVRDAAECDLMERITGPAEISGQEVAMELKPYEIKTFLFNR